MGVIFRFPVFPNIHFVFDKLVSVPLPFYYYLAHQYDVSFILVNTKEEIQIYS